MEDSTNDPDVGQNAKRKRVLKRHRELYDMMLNCKDVNEFMKLSKEYAELDSSYERLTNNDKLSIERCVRENEVAIIK